MRKHGDIKYLCICMMTSCT